MPQLRVLLGHQQGQVFSLDDRSVVIGRDPKSDIVLHPDSAASRRHAEVFPQEDLWRVRDLGSVNGTVLNGRAVRDEQLRDKDEVVIGDNVFVFENKDSDAAHIAEAASHTNAIESRGFQNRPEVQALVRGMSARAKALIEHAGGGGARDAEVCRDVLSALIAQGHVLLLGKPSPAKTALIRTISELLDLKFGSMEFTPTVMPDDLIGTMEAVASDPNSGASRFGSGAIFSQILLADAIDRAHPETQAALFGAMQDSSVAAGGQTWALPTPFMVVGTQNPLEPGDSAPLFEAQFDRFMFSVRAEDRADALDGSAAPSASAPSAPVQKVVTARQLMELQRAARDLPLSDHVVKYAVRLVRATRPGDSRAPEFIRTSIHYGAGPRAAQHLILGAKAQAILAGRLLVTTDDIRSVAGPVLRHRIFPNFSAESEGMDADKIIERLVKEVEEPGEKEA